MTKLFKFLVYILLSQYTFAQDYIIELGEEFKLTKKIDKIWIENPNLLQAIQIGQFIKIKSLNIGTTHIRINEEINKVIVAPLGMKESYKVWKRKSFQFINISPELCLSYLCLKGSVHSLNEIKKILNLKNELQTSVLFNLNVSDSITNNVDSWLEDLQRKNGLTPLKIIYNQNTNQPWKVLLPSKDNFIALKKKYEELGILAEESKQAFELSDNVKISIQITEVKKNLSRTLGIKHSGSYSTHILQDNTFNELLTDTSISANENQGNIKILASPNILCRSGKEAEFFAGGEFPIKVLNYKINDVVWKKYGINLKVKPLVDTVGQISLQIESEISNIDSSKTVDGIPGLQTNKVSSFFDFVKSKTIALSGLVKNEQGNSQQGLPFLQQIPILGYLFSSKDFYENQSELVIFVKPELSRQSGDM